MFFVKKKLAKREILRVELFKEISREGREASPTLHKQNFQNINKEIFIRSRQKNPKRKIFMLEKRFFIFLDKEFFLNLFLYEK
ncbi:hypothetical protein MSU_0128 [Mycoplasma suis str. Illinois]|uniref:Uncharacterized protein n=1 Tax=Mycoplasma suis (strain Illinois) TaxID=768700 RepID=F0QQA2_MYCSL|nr:hypothetical protein MSU_0128 [Mycoplasma suis str. Illinois]